jgi:hypothetical protein
MARYRTDELKSGDVRAFIIAKYVSDAPSFVGAVNFFKDYETYFSARL